MMPQRYMVSYGEVSGIAYVRGFVYVFMYRCVCVCVDLSACICAGCVLSHCNHYTVCAHATNQEWSVCAQG